MSKRNTKHKSEESCSSYHIVENREEIDLLTDDFTKIHQILRTDYYYMCRLEERLEYTILLNSEDEPDSPYKIFDKDLKIKEFKSKSEEYKKLYEKYDDEFLNENENYDFEKAIEDNKKHFENNKNYKNVLNFIKKPETQHEYFYEKAYAYIELSSKIEVLVNEMLQFLYYSRCELNNKLSINSAQVNKQFIFKKESDLLSDQFMSIHTDLDKYINYVIVNTYKDDESIKSYESLVKSKGKDGRLVICKQDFTYVNKLLIDKIVREYKETLVISDNIVQEKRTSQLKNLNRILLYIGLIGIFLNILNTHDTIANIRTYMPDNLIITIALLLTLIIAISFFIIDKKLFNTDIFDSIKNVNTDKVSKYSIKINIFDEDKDSSNVEDESSVYTETAISQEEFDTKEKKPSGI